MGEREDLSGKKYGRLTAVEIDWEKTKRRTYWLCQCECGKMKSVRSDCLKRGQVQSCGCFKKEQDETNLANKEKHGMTGTRLYNTWQNMKARCYNPNDERYHNYGGRGIKVCDKWVDDFNAFMEWAMNNGYQEDLTIDRIDNDGNYSPNNCRWATIKQQCNNRSSNIVIQYEGEEYNLLQLAKKLSIDAPILYARYRRGDRGKRLLRKPGEERITLQGKKNPNTKITKETAKIIKKRLANGEAPIDIARGMKVSKYIVYNIKRGETWNWI